MRSIEDIILAKDRRGISTVRSYLPDDFCKRAALLALSRVGPVLIVTGFYIKKAGKPETDGPPGALVLGEALSRLGRDISYVTDEPSLSMMQTLASERGGRVLAFPVNDRAGSEAFAKEILSTLNPSLLISVERCGPTRDGRYLNLRSEDISYATAKLDLLFQHHDSTIGIGDGGNEIGMGNVAHVIPQTVGLVDPCVTRATELVIAGVSNWGAYGLVAAMSRLTGFKLLPGLDQEMELVERVLALGAVDGISGLAERSVDGFSLTQSQEVLVALHQSLT